MRRLDTHQRSRPRPKLVTKGLTMFIFDARSGFGQNKFPDISSKVEIASVTASSLDRGFGHAPRPLSDQYRIPLADPGGAELQ
jgi:hypothetical protein